MRPFKKRQTYWWKCWNCGAMNKSLTLLKSKSTGEVVGRIIKCCNCGHELRMLDSVAAEANDINGQTCAGDQYCIRLRHCKYKDCILYNKKWNPDETEESKSCSGKCGCCNNKNCCNRCKDYPNKIKITFNNCHKFL